MIINNYNYSEYLSDSITSTLQQTYGNLEIIFVDDGSTDNSIRIASQWAEKIKIISKSNGGQASAYNKGWQAANGEWILFLDSDDRLHPSCIENLLQHVDTDVTKIEFPLQVIRKDGTPSGKQEPRRLTKKHDVKELLVTGACLSPPGSGNLYAKAFLDKIFPIPEEEWRIGADTYPITLSLIHGKVITVPTVLGDYRIHTLNSNNNTVSFNGALEIAKKQCKLVAVALNNNTDIAALTLELQCRSRLVQKLTLCSMVSCSNSSRVAIAKQAWKTSKCFIMDNTVPVKVRVCASLWSFCIAFISLVFAPPRAKWLLKVR